MSAYPGSAQEQRVSAEALKSLATTIFQRCRMSSADADLLAETLVVADLRGVHSHGVLRVPEYVEKLLHGGADPVGRPEVVKEEAAALVVDGHNCMGQISAAFAMNHAIERARTTNVAVAAVRGSNHCGAMAYFAMQALAEDMIGLAATNSIPTMAPWGGLDKIVGINPIGVAIPAAEEPPIVFDAAFSASSHGKMRVYQQKGAPFPSNWAYDASGRPTTDVTEALEGLLQPIGQYKGVGLGIVMGILSTLLSGASYGAELGNMIDGPKPGHDGHFLLALKVAAFEEPARFKARVDGIIREIRSSRPASSERLYAPGGLEAETEAEHRKQGVPLNSHTLADLASAADGLGVDSSAFLKGRATL